MQRMKRRILCLLFAMVCLAAGRAHAGEALDGSPQTLAISSIASSKYRLDHSHTSMIVRISHMGLSNYTLRFDRMDVDLDLNATDITRSRLDAALDITSVSTGDPKFDTLLEGPDWMKVSLFPTAIFTSKVIERTGPYTAKVTGDLTFMGVTKPLTLDARLNAAAPNYQGKPAIGFSVRGIFRRSDFGLTTFLPKVGDLITLEIEAEFIKK